VAQGYIGTCCLGFWCPCVLFGQTMHKAGVSSSMVLPMLMMLVPILSGYAINGGITFTLVHDLNWLQSTAPDGYQTLIKTKCTLVQLIKLETYESGCDDQGTNCTVTWADKCKTNGKLVGATCAPVVRACHIMSDEADETVMSACFAVFAYICYSTLFCVYRPKVAAATNSPESNACLSALLGCFPLTMPCANCAMARAVDKQFGAGGAAAGAAYAAAY